MIKNQVNQGFHEPVLKDEVLEALQVGESAHLKNCFIDATLGLGGHSEEILKRGGRILGIDTDVSSLEVARKKLTQVRLRLMALARQARLRSEATARPACPASESTENIIPEQFKLVHDNFRNIDKIAERYNIKNVSGILFDLGVSSPQLTSKTRGFSFQNKESLLDMRMDRKSQAVTASDLLNSLGESQLAGLFNSVLSRNQSRKLAKKIVLKRKQQPIRTVGDFLQLIGRGGKSGLHPATLPFMALRIAINSELENLKEVLPKAFELLASGGRLVIISFHSGEDVIVKKFFKDQKFLGLAKMVNKKPIIPGEIEINNNPRARSAKMRILEKV
ncbi:16S rRNA (cytosine(1402)-N(4))-methyltransferase RsmH [Patescibacteria group bacterium]|nr:16S rRNA (cytosine(1402)-N(4))-methyltransferase RsmH [Patescibacteria group bacterium]